MLLAPADEGARTLVGYGFDRDQVIPVTRPYRELPNVEPIRVAVVLCAVPRSYGAEV